VPNDGLSPEAGPIRKIRQHTKISPYVTGADWPRIVLPTAVPQVLIMEQSMT
jgi:beta-lactamase regulating signal transducer with metallopeptidase domain